MNITKKAAVMITLTGILLATSAFGYDDTSKERGRGGHQGPPPEAYCACEGKSEGDTAEFTSPRGDSEGISCASWPMPRLRIYAGVFRQG